jgi:hypothetical protein
VVVDGQLAVEHQGARGQLRDGSRDVTESARVVALVSDPYFPKVAEGRLMAKSLAYARGGRRTP